MKPSLKEFLDQKVDEYNRPSFIKGDPVSVPHRYTLKQDIEISGFLTALISWGNRTTIINSALRMMQAMGDAPYDFVLHHHDKDLKRLLDTGHRTFQATDLLYLVYFLRQHYRAYDSLEDAFLLNGAISMEERLVGFHQYVFSFEHPERTRKHIATPARHSACKRINMFLRWMVRKDERGVDFGLWSRIAMPELVIPLDVHVCNAAYRMGMIPEKKASWQTAMALTDFLLGFDAGDPVKYDYALFALGAEERVR